MQWIFNPPKSPWMGETMEALVKITKRCLEAQTSQTLQKRTLAVVQNGNQYKLSPICTGSVG